ncbi:MAG: hypothetical protein ABSD88_16970, partial [Candidatus Korobacteraceae bacterium]
DSLPRPVLEKIVERERVLETAKRYGLKLLPRQEVLVAEYSPKRIEEYGMKTNWSAPSGTSRAIPNGQD